MQKIEVFVVHGMNYFNFPDDHMMENVFLPKETKEAVHWLAEADPASSIVMFDGGADVSPELYGETNLYSYTNVERDIRETFLYHIARRNGFKIFALCRGHQFVAVMEGGTLWQDYQKQCGLNHHEGRHKIDVVHQSWVPVMKETDYNVTSTHHQAVRVIPNSGLETMIAPDGINEGIFYPEFGATMQSHPEYINHFAPIEYLAYTFKLGGLQ